MTRFSIVLTIAFLMGACVAPPSPLRIELVLANGRVIDPASGTDEVLNIGITGGKVVAMSAAPLGGDQVIDVTGLVVAPGFVDIHAHGLDPYSSSFQVRDGVTTALELEGGAFPMQEWYEEREGRWLTNFGASAGQGRVRRSILGAGSNRESLQPDQLRLLQEKISSAIDTGAIGIGVGLEYTPGASREEIYRMFELAAERSVTVFIHVRSGVPDEPRHAVGAMQEALANAAVTGSSLHILHVTSMALGHTPLVLEMIENAQGQGLDVTTEVYPYTAWATSIQSVLFEGDWQHDQSATYQDLEWAATGERLTPETFQVFRSQGGQVIGHVIPLEAVEMAVTHKDVIIASDGMRLEGGGHPRGAGTFARVLGRYVREDGSLTLMDALRKMTLLPAQRLESFVPAMRNKGRIQVGSDADITVFDAASIIDRATFQSPAQPSDGIRYVLVNGSVVVREGALVEGVYPGQPIRSVVTDRPPPS